MSKSESSPATPMSETLTRAAALLRQQATDLRESHTVPPEHERWRQDALRQEAEYAELMSVVAELGELERASETRTRDWQPIATAKGGQAEDILLFVPGLHGTSGTVVGHWAHGGGEDQPPFGPAWFFWTGFDFRELSKKPTHWMPLPEDPK